MKSRPAHIGKNMEMMLQKDSQFYVVSALLVMYFFARKSSHMYHSISTDFIFAIPFNLLFAASSSSTFSIVIVS